MKDVECNDVERSSEYKCPLTDASRCQQSSWDIILCLECNMFLLMSASLSPCTVLVRFVGRSMRAVPEAHVHHVWSSVLVLLNAQCWTCKLPQTCEKCQEVGDPEDMAQDAGQVNLDEDALKEIERDVEHSLDAAHFESKAKQRWLWCPNAAIFTRTPTSYCFDATDSKVVASTSEWKNT